MTPAPVPRLDAREFVGRREEFEQLSLETPLMLTHAFEAVEDSSSSGSGGGSSSPLRRFPSDEAFADRFFEAFAHAEVSYQRKGNARGARPELYEGPLAEVVGGMMSESRHALSWYMLSEDLLDTADDAALRSPLTLPPALFGGHDLFDLFPARVRPKKSCAILGGPGARSFLHADPYEWLGLNYLFEGEKVWTFVRPTPANERALGLQRVVPDAWDGEVGAGWKSDTVDLYHVEPRVVGGSVRLGLPPALAAAVPEAEVLACVQGEGELVVIPPRWSHQVYHLTPALALAWQVCTRATLPRVLRHVLEYCKEGGGGDGDRDVSTALDEVMAASPGYSEAEELVWARSKIEAAVERALWLRYGKERGSKEWARLKEGE